MIDHDYRLYVIHFKQKDYWQLFQFYETLVWVNKKVLKGMGHIKS